VKSFDARAPARKPQCQVQSPHFVTFLTISCKPLPTRFTGEPFPFKVSMSVSEIQYKAHTGFATKSETFERMP
jgi:hypothetical protein